MLFRPAPLLTLALLLSVAPPLSARTVAPVPGKVVVHKGPTPITGGSCTGADDLTVITPHFALSFAVTTLAPWGIPRGSILDAAPVTDGVIQEDRIGFIDFLPNGWQPWPSTRQEVRILSQTDNQVRILVDRDYDGASVRVLYTLRAESASLAAAARIVGPGGRDLGPILAGFSLCTRSGHVFGPPAPTDSHDWVAGYGPDWAVGMVVTGANVRRGGSSWRDLYREVDLHAGDTERFEARYRFNGLGSIAPVLLDTGASTKWSRLVGYVTNPPEHAVVLVLDGQQPVTWVRTERDGRFDLRLPPGRYRVRASAPGHGWTRTRDWVASPGASEPMELGSIPRPGTVRLTVQDDRGTPLPARIEHEGEPAVVSFLHQAITYTEPTTPGHALLRLPPGRQSVRISGGGFGVPPARVELDITAGTSQEHAVTLSTVVDLRTAGWYCADLHHHSNLADGVTPPARSVLSQQAAGLDFVTITDHDLVTNHGAFRRAAAAAGMPAILGIEVSPSWGHFNLWPLPEGHDPALPAAATTPDAIVGAARAVGAAVQVNHPWEGSNAYFRSWLLGKVPGPVSWDFDFVEINADDGFGLDDATALTQVRQSWNRGERKHLLTAGSDTHDVYSDDPWHRSGAGRTCVFLDREEPTVKRFFDAVRAGYSYVSLGPGIVLSPAPGPVSPDTSGHVVLNLEAYAARHIRDVLLVADGETIQTLVFEEGTDEILVRMDVPAADAHWFQVVVTDDSGSPAISNPYFVR